ncbi:MAG: glycosyltransferase, partial [Pseudomonadota bacterium]|nr:glycosyltransferase [Pseudomonadota bacterium]
MQKAAEVLTASIVFLSYRDRQWVDAALDGVLAQTVPCQLLISNDAGDDGTFERIAERLQGYQGHHRIDLLLKQPQNLGVVGSCNAVLPQASGDIVVMMAGDDVSAPDRVEKLLAAYAAHPQTMAIGTDFEAVDGEDRPVSIDFKTEMLHFDLHHLAHSRALHTLLGAALSFRREVFSRFGPLRGMVEDNALTLRACLLGDCRNLPEKLVRYRQHSGSISHRLFAREVEDARELKRIWLRRT